MSHKTRIMYMEQKTGDGAGEARIGRVSYSHTGRTLYYKDKAFVPSGGQGIHGNYYGYDRSLYSEWVNQPLIDPVWPLPGFLAEFWVSGPKKNGQDRHDERGPVQIDADVAEEYWQEVRGQA
jgi:hypothetical protein